MKTLRMVSAGLLAIGCAAVVTVSLGGSSAVQNTAAPAIDADDLGGIVTGPKGPEAGVWVIAETSDLPTRFVRIVVTDEQGRYVLPDLPKANYNVWVRGYGLVDSPKVQSSPGKVLNLTAVVAPDARAAAQVLSRRLLALAAQSAGQERISGHWPVRQRHRARHKEPGAVAAHHQVGDVHSVPPAWNQGHAGAPAESWHVPDVSRRVGTAAAVGAGRSTDDQWSRAARPRSRAGALCRLDRSHPRRRGPARAAAATRDRAQRRHHSMGLG